MKRKHLKYTFPEPVVQTTQAFMDEKPWNMDLVNEEANRDFVRAAQAWVNILNTTYEVPPVNVLPSEEVDGYMEGGATPDGVTDSRIFVKSNSMIRLFSFYGWHLARNEKLDGPSDFRTETEEEAISWAYGVFYRAKPEMFRARVREGRIHLDPYCLYNSATEQALRDYDIDPTDSHALTKLAEAQRAAIADGVDESEVTDEVTSDPISETPVSTGNATRAFADADRHVADLQSMNTRELRRHATSIGITGAWSMNKSALLAALGVSEEAAS